MRTCFIYFQRCREEAAAHEATAESLVPTAAYGDIGLGTEL